MDTSFGERLLVHKSCPVNAPMTANVLGTQFLATTINNAIHQNVMQQNNQYNMSKPPTIDYRSTLSPISDPNSPLDWQTANMELDDAFDIKMEPFEDFMSAPSSNIDQFGNMETMGNDSLLMNYLQNVSPQKSEDFYMSQSNNMDMNQTDDGFTTCLDPQHSSPAAMTAVRPDDVLGFSNRSDCSARTPFDNEIGSPCYNNMSSARAGSSADFNPPGDQEFVVFGQQNETRTFSPFQEDFPRGGSGNNLNMMNKQNTSNSAIQMQLIDKLFERDSPPGIFPDQHQMQDNFNRTESMPTKSHLSHNSSQHNRSPYPKPESQYVIQQTNPNFIYATRDGNPILQQKRIVTQNNLPQQGNRSFQIISNDSKPSIIYHQLLQNNSPLQQNSLDTLKVSFRF